MNAKGSFAIGLLGVLVAATGCSGTVVGNERGTGGDADGGDMPDASPDDEKDAGLPSPYTDAGVQDAFEEYVDPGCPDAAEPLFAYDCDPFAPPPGDCPEDHACYPFVEYPSEPCAAEIYGSFCLPTGTQTQGEFCVSATDCAAGFVCVVSGAGNQCVRLCSLTDPKTCPDGQICEPLDVAGYGGCL